MQPFFPPDGLLGCEALSLPVRAHHGAPGSSPAGVVCPPALLPPRLHLHRSSEGGGSHRKTPTPPLGAAGLRAASPPGTPASPLARRSAGSPFPLVPSPSTELCPRQAIPSPHFPTPLAAAATGRPLRFTARCYCELISDSPRGRRSSAVGAGLGHAHPERSLNSGNRPKPALALRPFPRRGCGTHLRRSPSAGEPRGSAASRRAGATCLGYGRPACAAPRVKAERRPGAAGRPLQGGTSPRAPAARAGRGPAPLARGPGARPGARPGAAPLPAEPPRRRGRRARPVPPGDVQGARWQHLPARGLKRRRKEGAKHESPSEPQPPPAAEGASPGPAAAAAVPARGHPSYGTTSGGLPPPPAARPAPSLGASARQRPLLNLCRSRGRRASSTRSPPPVLSERRSPRAARSAPRSAACAGGREGGVFPKCKEKSVGFPSSPPSGAFARSLRHDAQDAAVQAAAGGRGSLLLRGGRQVRRERRPEEKVPQRDPAAAAEEARPAAAVPGGAGRRGGDVPRPLPAPLLLLPRRRAGAAARRGQGRHRRRRAPRPLLLRGGAGRRQPASGAEPAPGERAPSAGDGRSAGTALVRAARLAWERRGAAAGAGAEGPCLPQVAAPGRWRSGTGSGCRPGAGGVGTVNEPGGGFRFIFLE